jgi:hypothetical protein
VSRVSAAEPQQQKKRPGSGRSAAGQRSRGEDELRVAFEHGRWRHFGWLLAGTAGGAFLVWKLGTVGKGVGLLLILIGLINAIRFARTLMQPAGVIEVDDEAVELPEGLCRKDVHRVPFAGIRHVFFLRRSVPWTLTGPVLVIETDERVYRYPRDWFASDSDQRRVAHAIHRRLETT